MGSQETVAVGGGDLTSSSPHILTSSLASPLQPQPSLLLTLSLASPCPDPPPGQ